MTSFRFHSDATFHIGQFHVAHISPCEDFADSFVSENGDTGFMVVSDGCSTGGQTDIGSRFVARRLYAEAQMKFATGSVSDLKGLEFSQTDLEPMALLPADVYATSLWACFAQAYGQVTVLGDGAVALLYKDGRYVFDCFQWADNTPFYPIYASKLGRELGLLESFITAHRGNSFPFTRTTALVRGNAMELSEQQYSLSEAVAGISYEFDEPALASLSAVALFSDGVTQLAKTSESNHHLDWTSVIKQCVEFRNTTGAFLKRRVRRALQTWAKDEVFPQDDLAAAVMLIDQDQASASQKEKV